MKSKIKTLIDVEKARRETPGVVEKLHFNNAGAALVPKPVLDAQIGHLELESRIGAYEAANKEAQKLEHVYHALASLLNCSAEEIAFVENATRAWDMAFYSLKFQPGDRILTAMAEYASNYIAFLQVKKRSGAIIDVIPNDETGQLDVHALKNALDHKVKLIAVTHVPTNGGLVNPAREIGAVARAAGITYLLDACQSVGQMPVDVNEIGCDILSATGRKFLRGPRATGFLYVRKPLLETMEPPFLDLHAAEWIAPDKYEICADAKRFENWETNFAGKIALGTAVDYAMDWGLEAIEERVVMLADELRAALCSIPGVTVHDLGQRRCGIVSFSKNGVAPQEIKQRLAQKNINVSVTDTSSTRLDMESRQLSLLVRSSVHYYNTMEEVDRFSREVAAID